MNYRNKKLLQLARECPFCMHCRKVNQGDVVAAHSNQLRDGKGMGIKANDYRIAYLCGTCHMEIDQGNRFEKEERIRIWEEAHRRTIGWLFDSGHLEIRN